MNYDIVYFWTLFFVLRCEISKMFPKKSWKYVVLSLSTVYVLHTYAKLIEIQKIYLQKIHGLVYMN